MTDEELYNKLEGEFKTYKDKKLADGIKDEDFYGIALRYTLLEWVGQRLLDSEDRREEIDYLKTKAFPLEYLYDRWLKTDDELWNTFDDMLYWDVKHNKGE